MSSWTIRQQIDLARGLVEPRVLPTALLMQGDKQAHVWRVTVLQDGQAATLAGTVRGYFQREGGSFVTVTGTISGNTAIVTFVSGCYEVPGALQCVMRLTSADGNTTTTLGVISALVEREPTGAVVDPERVIPDLEVLLAKIALMESGTTAANTAASAANAAATSATNAAGAANTAAGAANTAANAANTAAGNANTKATAADTAAGAANTAANAANTAAGNANTKATAADTAASAANTAAASANTAATAANALVNRVVDLEADVQRIDWKTGIKKYIIRWDKANAQCTRMGDASAITTTVTNFAHRGSLNASYSNPFDALYPWSQRKLCKVDRTAYKTIRDAGGDILGAVTMWEGENGFALDGTGDFDGVYTPEFWGYIWQDATYVYAAVADGYVQGWDHFPATIGGRYHGSLDASGKMTSIANSIAWRGAAMSTMHSNAVTQGMTLDDIFTWAADTLLLCVEYATLNTQTAVGNGCDSLYSAGATGSEYRPGAAAALGATALIIPNALATALAVGGVIDVGTSNEGTNVCYVRTTAAPVSLDASDPLYATHKSVAVTALPAAVTTVHYLALHGCYNAPDSDIGSKSGYIGTSGKCNAYYRGRVAHGNYWRYVLGAYRQTGTSHIWVANNRASANAADALNTAVHRDTGLVLPTGAEGAAVSGYLNSLLIDDDMPLAPFGGSIGGSSANPVGDYLYVPTLATGNTVLRAGAYASTGVPVGRFYGSWNFTAGIADWFIAALPFLIAP